MIKQYSPAVKPYLALNQRMSNSEPLHPNPFSIPAISKESLEKHPSYLFLKDRLISYNKKVVRGGKVDEYEVRMFEKLYQLMLDLTTIDDLGLQERQIRGIQEWLGENERIVKSRVEQGMERTVVTKESRKVIEELDKLFNLRQELPKTKQSNIPSEVALDAALPYFRKWRTIHEDIPLPSTRLNYYERKLICEQPATNPVSPSKYSILDQPIPQYKDYSTAYNSIMDRTEEDQKEGQTQIQQSQLSLNNEENELPEEIVLDDIPMFGDEINEDGEQSREENTDGDLVPNIKLYLSATERKQEETEKTTHMFMKLKESVEARRRDMRFKHNRTIEVIKNNEDKEIIKLTSKRAKNKSSAFKEQSMRHQQSTLSPQYSKMKERREIDFRLNDQLQRKYDLHPIKAPIKDNRVDLSLRFPQLPSRTNTTSNSTQKHSLLQLKKKYNSILQLPSEDRTQNPQGVPKSIAQFSKKPRPYFSFDTELINSNSPINSELNRVQQFNQLQNVKDKFHSKRIGINIQTLANGLISPESKQAPSFSVVEKNLMHNQFMVEVKRKKKA